MPLEAATYISELVATNPAPGDLKAQGDDHIRMEKRVLKAAFAGIPGVVYITGTDGGAANAYTVAPADVVPAYGLRMLIAFAPIVANTDACTLAVASLGAKALVTASGDPLAAGDLLAGVLQVAIYDGTQFRLLAVTKGYVDRGDAANLAYTKQAEQNLRNYIDNLVVSAVLPNQTLGFMRSDGTNAAFTRTHTGYAQNEVRGADIASAATINLTTATGNFVHVTGTTTISAITIPDGAAREIVFDGALTLVHGAGLRLQGGTNIVTTQGDRAFVRGDAAGPFLIFQRVSGLPVVGGVISKEYRSPDQTITPATTITMSHGLGTAPKLVMAYLRCVTASSGLQVGDIALAPMDITSNDGNGTKGCRVSANQTTIMVTFANGSSAGVGDGEPFRNYSRANFSFFIEAFA